MRCFHDSRITFSYAALFVSCFCHRAICNFCLHNAVSINSVSQATLCADFTHAIASQSLVGTLPVYCRQRITNHLPTFLILQKELSICPKIMPIMRHLISLIPISRRDVAELNRRAFFPPHD
jgi:hypothetical protein